MSMLSSSHRAIGMFLLARAVPSRGRSMRIIAAVSALSLLAISCNTETGTGPNRESPGVPFDGPLASIAQPALASMVFFGGSGDQLGSGIAIVGASAYVSGSGVGPIGLLMKFGLPPASPVWSATLASTDFVAVAANPTTAFPVGGAVPTTCGASDGSGDTERKSLLARYGAGGGLLGCGSTNFFPYRGHEYYSAALTLLESGTPFVYAGGQAEQTGFAASNPFVLAKHDAGGSIVNQVTEPGITLGSFSGCCPGESGVLGIAEHGGDIYLAGFSRLPGFGEDNVYRPVLMRYSPALARVWKARPTDNADGFFRAVAAVGGYLYVVGRNGSGGAADYLVEKYDQSGTRIWTATSGGAGEDVLTGIVGVGSRLFAVGYTRSSGAGGVDAAILEIDPATGATISTSLFGGSQDDLANGTATDGTDLYVVGETRSFASVEGNAVGQNDGMLLRYTLAEPYDFTGFFPPVDNPGVTEDVVNRANAGRGIPVKFSLAGDQGLDIFEPGHPKFVSAPCDNSDSQDPIEETTTSPAGLTYDPTTDQYTYVWKSQKAWAGRCGTFHLGLNDGSDHHALFRFVR